MKINNMKVGLLSFVLTSFALQSMNNPAQIKNALKNKKDEIVNVLSGYLATNDKYMERSFILLSEQWKVLGENIAKYIEKNSVNLARQTDKLIFTQLQSLNVTANILNLILESIHSAISQQENILNQDIMGPEKIFKMREALWYVEQHATQIVADVNLKKLQASRSTLPSKKKAIESLREWATFVALLASGVMKVITTTS